MEKRALNITDIAEMIYLADGVLDEARAAFMFNDNGVRLHGDAIKEQAEKDEADGINDFLVNDIFYSADRLSDAIETTPETILEKLSPIKSRILGMFRNGEVNTEFYPADGLYADPSVPDEWLLELFAMRVRDRMISFTLQAQAADGARIEAARKGGQPI